MSYPCPHCGTAMVPLQTWTAVGTGSNEVPYICPDGVCATLHPTEAHMLPPEVKP